MKGSISTNMSWTQHKMKWNGLRSNLPLRLLGWEYLVQDLVPYEKWNTICSSHTSPSLPPSHKPTSPLTLSTHLPFKPNMLHDLVQLPTERHVHQACLVDSMASQNILTVSLFLGLTSTIPRNNCWAPAGMYDGTWNWPRFTFSSSIRKSSSSKGRAPWIAQPMGQTSRTWPAPTWCEC